MLRSAALALILTGCTQMVPVPTSSTSADRSQRTLYVLSWETDLVDVERERYYDSTFETQYAAAGAQRESPSWHAGRPIQVTLWLEFEGRLYQVALAPTVISRSI